MSEKLKKLEADIADARRNRAGARLTTLTVLLSKVQKIAKDDRKNPGRDVTDGDVAVAAQTYVKETSEARAIYAARGLDHAKEDEEISTVSAYLPEALDEERLAAIIDEVLATTDRTPKAIGKVVSYLKERHVAAYDPDVAMAMIKARLA